MDTLFLCCNSLPDTNPGSVQEVTILCYSCASPLKASLLCTFTQLLKYKCAVLLTLHVQILQSTRDNFINISFPLVPSLLFFPRLFYSSFLPYFNSRSVIIFLPRPFPSLLPADQIAENHTTRNTRLSPYHRITKTALAMSTCTFDTQSDCAMMLLFKKRN